MRLQHGFSSREGIGCLRARREEKKKRVFVVSLLLCENIVHGECSTGTVPV